jgi:prevent-host-death family protein
MPRSISATEARVHFGKIIREAADKGEPIFVDPSGGPQVVIVSRETWDRVSGRAEGKPKWRVELEKAWEMVERDRGRRPLPDIEAMIRDMREERSAELENNLLRREHRDEGSQ